MVPIRDEIVPRKPLIKIFKNSGIKKNISKMIDLGVYENSYHMILRDLEGSKIINDIRLWIENKNSIKQNNVFKDSLRKLNNNPYFHRLDK